MISLMLVSIFFILKPSNEIIKADGKGYYDYLPSIFIEGDFVRFNSIKEDNLDLYNRINKEGVYADYEDYRVNKYTSGVAVLVSPFFLCNALIYETQGLDYNGYESSFQYSVAIAALFYMLLSLILIRKILSTYDVQKNFIRWSQVFLCLSTSLIIYVNYEASFSHVYSLFAFSGFIYYSRTYFISLNTKKLIIAMVFLGLILLLKQVNLLILVFLPFLSGSWSSFKSGIINLISKPGLLVSSLIIVFAIFFIQCLAWYLQTGDFLLYSYPGESFDFSDPHIFGILFSYKKGLFVYTPILFLSLGGLIILWQSKRRFEFYSWIIAMLFVVFVFSSWWSWYFGGSFGNRGFIEYYPLFFIIFGLLLQNTSSRVKKVILFLGLLTIPLCQVQALQYKSYILHMIDMTKEKYWKIFMRTDTRLTGVFYKDQFVGKEQSLLKEIHIDEIKSIENYYLEFNKFVVPSEYLKDEIKAIEIKVKHTFPYAENTRLGLMIKDPVTDSIKYFRNPYLIHYANDYFNKVQVGQFTFAGLDYEIEGGDEIVFFLDTKEDGVELRDVEIRLSTSLEDLE